MNLQSVRTVGVSTHFFLIKPMLASQSKSLKCTRTKSDSRKTTDLDISRRLKGGMCTLVTLDLFLFDLRLKDLHMGLDMPFAALVLA